MPTAIMKYFFVLLPLNVGYSFLVAHLLVFLIKTFAIKVGNWTNRIQHHTSRWKQYLLFLAATLVELVASI